MLVLGMVAFFGICLFCTAIGFRRQLNVIGIITLLVIFVSSAISGLIGGMPFVHLCSYHNALLNNTVL
jgi:hypothetical protein